MEEIIVTIPRERPFGSVAGLVLGGVAARHELTLDVLDDLQLALETLLEHTHDERQISVVLRVEDGNVGASVGPFRREEVEELEQETDKSLGLRRLLQTLVDSVGVSERDDGCWVDLRRAYVATPAAL